MATGTLTYPRFIAHETLSGIMIKFSPLDFLGVSQSGILWKNKNAIYHLQIS